MGTVAPAMRIDVDTSQHQLTWPQLRDRVLMCEDLGFGGAWVFDHFKALYGPATGPCFEGWSLLAALAAVTTRIRLGPLVTGVTYRHPSVLAAQAVTVDHVSDGRLDFGIGAAWFEAEHRQFGIEFPPAGERVSRLEEAVTVIRKLMTEEKATFDGRYYRLDGADYRPRPVQQPHPPIWVGGDGQRVLGIAGRHADVWHGSGSPAELARRSEVLEAAARKAGRDPSTIVRSTYLSLSEPWDEVRRTAEELHQAGFSILIASWPSEGQERLEAFARDLLPELSAL